MQKVINISSRIENLSEVERLVDEISSECNMSSEIYGNVLIATLEAANNAILHGNKLDEEKDVNIQFKWDKKELQLVVTDQGKGFDFNNIPDPTAPENVEKVSGQGDEIEFLKNGSKVRLTFNL